MGSLSFPQCACATHPIAFRQRASMSNRCEDVDQLISDCTTLAIISGASSAAAAALCSASFTHLLPVCSLWLPYATLCSPSADTWAVYCHHERPAYHLLMYCVIVYHPLTYSVTVMLWKNSGDGGPSSIAPTLGRLSPVVLRSP